MGRGDESGSALIAMAGDWIKVEHATVDKPEVLAMAEWLETSADDVLGKLIRVWLWFDKQSLDGNAGSVTGVTLKKFIDRLVASQGFAACMQKVGWLTDAGIPNFDRHNGESAKNRALTNKRVKRLRNEKSNDDVTPNALPEKRRVVTPIVPKGPRDFLADAPEGFRAFWQAWQSGPRKAAGQKCLDLWQQKKYEKDAPVILAHVATMKQSRQWRDGYDPAPIVYLRNAQWIGAEPIAVEQQRMVV